MSIQQGEIERKTQVVDTGQTFDLLPYPIDMSPFFISPPDRSDTVGLPYTEGSSEYQPVTVAQGALLHWKLYLVTDDKHSRRVFLARARWFVEHAISIGIQVLHGEDSAGWPIFLPRSDTHRGGPCLSALVQGSAISVLVRAYQLTHEEVFLETARRAVHTFECDILDGGISTPVGVDGVFFEEVAVYPAAHRLNGFIFALFGLYDYVSVTGDAKIEQIISRSLVSLHNLLGEFDAGFWTRADLLHRRLASPAELALQAMLLEALAKRSGCDFCATSALRWKGYSQRWSSRLRWSITSRFAALSHMLWSRVRIKLFPDRGRSRTCPAQAKPILNVCIPTTAFPFTGGVLTVLEGIAQVTKDLWHIEYMAQIIGPDAAKYVLHRFGTAKMAPWHFPHVWLHTLAGAQKLFSLLRRGAHYQVILPQDALFTAMFAALVGKLAGIRVVCIDHSTLTWPTNRVFRAERIAAIRRKPWHWTFQLFVLLMLQLYWPSLALMARLVARLADHFLIPGAPGDEVEEACKRAGVPLSRLTRFASMINVERHKVFDTESRAAMRQKKGIAADAIVVAIICRLEAEKGLEVAVESISRALSSCSSEVRSRVRVIIAGDGLLRKQLEEDIQRHELSQTCTLWGDMGAEEVISLLGISNIFLYTSTRGACLPMSILEAMASGCAVIASTQPMVNAQLLAEGRGIAVPPGDAEQTALALERLVNDLELAHQMGKLARDYVALYHSPETFRRALMRVTYCAPLGEAL